MSIKLISNLLAIFLISGILLSGCKKDPEDDIKEISGCTDPAADNYNAQATIEAKNCIYQNRFSGKYNINVACDQSSALFSDAQLEIKPASNKDQIAFFITSSSTDIHFLGRIISKDTVVVDTLIPNFKADLKNLIPLATESKIITVDLGIKSKFGLTKDIRNLDGDMKLKLISKDTVEYNGLKIPPITLDDNCTLKATKQ
ncbi:MAG TPA: hypothetical protein PK047_11235 [Saprospiraceae bacterium]|nr:hypothetical protein [Saprospiraceae bacterium]HRO09431.1 hypothetical protein [Saprospiraceae bacterium]HRP42710.1 hypothetical protein [Saprospiraceae bacterium]